MRFLIRVYSTYGIIMFGLIFLLLLPFFLILMLRRSWHRYALLLNQCWCRGFFLSLFVPPHIKWKARLKKQQAYVFAPNHFSLLDIPAMGYAPKPFVFVGKSSLTKVPLFGFMFKKLHITVNRERVKDRYRALKESYRAVDEGKSVVMFPEGGIRSPDAMQLAAFKNGPFRVAIEKQIPVVPVTMPYNGMILPDDNKFLMQPKRPVIIFHEPIATVGMTEKDIDQLRNQTFQVIQQELLKYFPHLQPSEDRRPETEDRSFASGS